MGYLFLLNCLYKGTILHFPLGLMISEAQTELNCQSSDSLSRLRSCIKGLHISWISAFTHIHKVLIIRHVWWTYWQLKRITLLSSCNKLNKSWIMNIVSKFTVRDHSHYFTVYMELKKQQIQHILVILHKINRSKL